MLKLFANLFWIYLPSSFQKQFSSLFSRIFQMKISRYFILPYSLVFGLSANYLDQFEPDSGEVSYYSFSDFFKRKYKSGFDIRSKNIWPCEGYVCDWGLFSEKNNSIVKGQVLDLNEIFHSNPEQTSQHFFLNIFLHNHNYHRVHSPVTGTISKITNIPGGLVFLRPWFYKRADVSFPAIRNERVVFEILDNHHQLWYLAMVGGFGVGSVQIGRNLHPGSEVKVGEEIAKFDLGSTVCLATPMRLQPNRFLQTVNPGEELQPYENII